MTNAIAKRTLSRADRLALYVTFGVLWASGITWLVLDLWFAVPGEFGVSPHPWSAPLLLIHGVLAIPALWLIGWVTARHSTLQWRARLRRRSGGSFAAALLLLSVSGFGLFFLSSDAGQRVFALTHEAVGVLFTLFVLEHWYLGRRR